MRYLKYGSGFLGAAALAFSIMSFSPSPKEKKIRAPFEKRFLTNVRSCIDFNKEIAQKEEIFALLDQVENKYQILEQGSDDLRVKYVNAQGAIEHVMACFQALGEIDQLIGVIHTPMPPTPLCVKPEGNVQDILDASIRSDQNKLLTVRSRAQIVREYLMKGGKLYAVYPQGGLQKRTPEQQSIYKEALDQSSTRLVDWVLGSDKIDQDMIGATYLFRNLEGKVFAFSIKSRQVNDIQKQTEWGIWFGPVQEKTVADRVNTIFDYLSSVGGPDPRKEM